MVTTAGDDGAQRLAAHQLAVLLSAGDPTRPPARRPTGGRWGRGIEPPWIGSCMIMAGLVHGVWMGCHTRSR